LRLLPYRSKSALCRSLCRNWMVCLPNCPYESQARPMPSS
jgi:hypothetical protein